MSFFLSFVNKVTANYFSPVLSKGRPISPLCSFYFFFFFDVGVFNWCNFKHNHHFFYFSYTALSFPASCLLDIINITLQFGSLLLISSVKGHPSKSIFLSFSENFAYILHRWSQTTAICFWLRIVALCNLFYFYTKRLLKLLILNQMIPISVPYSNEAPS